MYYVHAYPTMYHTIIVYLQLYERCSKVTHGGEEKERFAALTLDYMSEESSSDGGETMFVHQPPWRSNSKQFYLIVYSLLSFFRTTFCIALNGYLKDLDAQVAEANSNGKQHILQRKSSHQHSLRYRTSGHIFKVGSEQRLAERYQCMLLIIDRKK